MPGSNCATDTGWVRLEAPSTTTTNCEDVTLPSPVGTTTLICVSLPNRICPGKPPNVTPIFFPARSTPNSEAIDPGTAGPAAKDAPLTTLETVGRAGVVTAAVTTNVMGTAAEPCPAYIVSVAWYVPGARFAGDASMRMVVLSIPLSG